MNKKISEDWVFLIDVKKPIAKYFDWELFLNPLAKVEGYDGKIPSLFIGKRVIDGQPLNITVKGETIGTVKNRIDTQRKSSMTFRNKCKTMLVSTKKCDYCCDRFVCFTEKKWKEKLY